MIAQIIPFAKMPRGARFFDYQIPDSITVTPGDLVAIPFRARTLQGVVYSTSPSSAITKLKSIITVIEPDFLDEWQLYLLTWFCNYYYVSWPHFAYHFFPVKPKRQLEYKPYIPKTNIQISLPDSAKNSFITTNNKVQLYLHQTRHEQYSLILGCIKNPPTTRTVVLFPSIDSMAAVYHALKPMIQSNVICFSSETNKTQQWNIWKNIQSEEQLIVFATRSSIAWFDGRATTFVVVDSESIDHTQYDLNPRYDVRVILQERIKRHTDDDAVVFSTLAPTIEHYTYATSGYYQLHNRQSAISGVELHERAKHFSEHPLVSEKIASVIATHKHVFLYINRKGSFTSFGCRDCSWLATCSYCKHVLKSHRTQLRCHHCGHTETAPNICPRCAKQQVAGFGMGAKNIEVLVAKLFPKYQVIRIDSDSESVVFDSTQEKYIIVGTQFALDKIDFEHIDCFVSLNADLDSISMNYRTHERMYQLYQRLFRSLPANAKKIIQVNSLEHSWWSVITQPFVDFWKHEIPQRRKYKLPPFYKLSKLLFADSDIAVVRSESKKTFQQLQTLSGIETSPPQPREPQKYHQKYSQSILIKHKTLTIDAVVASVPVKCLIDRDPETI